MALLASPTPGNITLSACAIRFLSLLKIARIAQALQCKLNALYISCSVINNYDLHRYSYNIPLVEGRIIFSRSRLTAILMALANALKMASILWCSLVPSALIFRLAFAPSVNDLKK